MPGMPEGVHTKTDLFLYVHQRESNGAPRRFGAWMPNAHAPALGRLGICARRGRGPGAGPLFVRRGELRDRAQFPVAVRISRSSIALTCTHAPDPEVLVIGRAELMSKVREDACCGILVCGVLHMSAADPRA